MCLSGVFCAWMQCHYHGACWCWCGELLLKLSQTSIDGGPCSQCGKKHRRPAYSSTAAKQPQIRTIGSPCRLTSPLAAAQGIQWHPPAVALLDAACTVLPAACKPPTVCQRHLPELGMTASLRRPRCYLSQQQDLHPAGSASFTPCQLAQSCRSAFSACPRDAANMWASPISGLGKFIHRPRHRQFFLTSLAAPLLSLRER